MVFSHSPIQKIYKGWNFWTEDAEEVQALLRPFEDVTVIYGHVHQIQYNQIDNMRFHAVMATAWPWPYPQSYAQAESHLPKLTVPMNRADPFFERDATGWQIINMDSGNVSMEYNLYNNTSRTVAFNKKTGKPEDSAFQDPSQPDPAADPLLEERGMNKKILGTALMMVTFSFTLGLLPVSADEFTQEDLKRWEQEFMSVVEKGRALWGSPELGTNGVACGQCHPNAANTHPETYPKFQKQLGKVITLREMINWCLRNPLEGQPLALDDPRMVAMEAYVTYERRGVKMEPGKH